MPRIDSFSYRSVRKIFPLRCAQARGSLQGLRQRLIYILASHPCILERSFIGRGKNFFRCHCFPVSFSGDLR